MKSMNQRRKDMNTSARKAIALVIFVTQTLVSSASAVHGRMISSRSCMESELEALISLKRSFVDTTGRLSSWRGKYCCQWKGVGCSNQTGHVVKLDLRNQNYSERILSKRELDSSIATLRRLRYLDLSFNDFNYTRIPTFLGTLSNMRYLNLSKANFVGNIPSQLGNLSSLQYLDLSIYSLSEASDLTWLPRLSSLKALHMNWVNLSSARNWVRKVNMLPNLKILSLSGCRLHSAVSGVSKSNLTHLEVLHLSSNPFNSLLQHHNWFWGLTTIKELHLSENGWSGHVPNALGNMSSLEVIYLDRNNLRGTMPATLEKLCNLSLMDISWNGITGDMMKRLPKCSWSKLREIHSQGTNLTGQLPVWIGNLTSLSYLDLSQNMLDREIPDGIGSLSNLTYLDLGLNNFSGMISKQHFRNLVNLEYLKLSENSLKLHFGDDWVPPFRLSKGYFRLCDMGYQFPAWLRWQTGLRYLDISDTKIHDVLPQWFWAIFSNASHLDLSINQLTGVLPSSLELPLMGDMDLSRNALSGKLPANLTAPYLKKLLLYNNNFTGTIPAAYVCGRFQEINLSNNQLTGDSPQCPQNTSSLLLMVDLKNNHLSGEFPLFLRMAAYLKFLDLSHNNFSGSVPTWIGEQMPYIKVLILRSNMFKGPLPKQLTKMVGLHYLDLAHNNISGSIPSSLAGLIAMTEASNRSGANNYSSDSVSTFIKDRELNYTHELTEHVVLIDFSSNGFTGYIPKELSLLKALRSLNLSNNQISGPIPDDIGSLRELESLDLSYNYFTGEIPSSLSDLTFLSCLNLSYNDLSGRIPSGQQLQTLNNQYMYIGNPGLCGPPLLSNCSTNETGTDVNQEHESTIYDTLFLYLSISSGYHIGLWTVFCTLLIKKTWRIAYFRHFDQLYNKIYVQAALSKAAIIRKFRNQET